MTSGKNAPQPWMEAAQQFQQNLINQWTQAAQAFPGAAAQAPQGATDRGRAAGSITQDKKMSSKTLYLPFVAAMALVVVASNILVQFPVDGQVGSLALADILTWGAFTYPFAFLVSELVNRFEGAKAARRHPDDGR